MERRLKTNHCHPGFALPLVLILTVIGALFGAGSLLLFKYQCHQRINRQHELEKVYAVRSAANYARVAWQIPRKGSATTYDLFDYISSSGRDLKVKVEPVKRIFPSSSVDSSHLDFGKEVSTSRGFGLCSGQYNNNPDYEYGMENEKGEFLDVTSDQINNMHKSANCLAFRDNTATNGVKWWVNIGMKDIGGWLQENYGRRYFFQFGDIVRGANKADIVRLCLIRDVVHDASNGCRHGWPLQGTERALLLELRVRTNDIGDIYLYENGNATAHDHIQFKNSSIIGLQLAGRRAYLFYVSNEVGLSGGFVLSDGWEMRDTDDIYKYFSSGSASSDLRAVIEVEADADGRPFTGSPSENTKYVDCIKWFRVTPAYQFDVSLKCPEWSDYRLATVVQKTGIYNSLFTAGGKNPYNYGFSMMTYDTHGTAWKGYKVRE